MLRCVARGQNAREPFFASIPSPIIDVPRIPRPKFQPPPPKISRDPLDNPHGPRYCIVHMLVLYENPMKAHAHTLYAKRGMSREDAARISGAGLSRLDTWRKEDEWDADRKAFLETARDAAATAVGLRIADTAAPLVDRYLSAQDKILAEVERRLDDLDGIESMTPAQLRSLASAVSSMFPVFSGLSGSAGVVKPQNTPGELPPIQVNILNSLNNALEEKRIHE